MLPRTSQRPRWVRIVLPVAASALVVLLAAAGLLRRGERSGVGDMPEDQDALVQYVMTQDPDELLMQLAAMIEENADDPEAQVEFFQEERFMMASSTESWLAELSDTQWVATLVGAYDIVGDLDTVLGSLNDDETEVLRELLIEYAQEGLQI